MSHFWNVKHWIAACSPALSELKHGSPISRFILDIGLFRGFGTITERKTDWKLILKMNLLQNFYLVAPTVGFNLDLKILACKTCGVLFILDNEFKVQSLRKLKALNFFYFWLQMELYVNLFYYGRTEFLENGMGRFRSNKCDFWLFWTHFVLQMNLSPVHSF